MDGITRVKSLNEAFEAVRKRRSFVYHHSPEVRFLYYPKDDLSAWFLIALKSNTVNLKHCSQIAAEMGVFGTDKPVESIAHNGWRCFCFDLELKKLV